MGSDEQRAREIVIAAEFIADEEGYHRKLSDGRARAYPDPLHGWAIPTIGYGTTVYPDGTRVQRGDVRDEPYLRECMMHFIEQRCLPHLRKIATWNQMTTNQRAALISFGYNLGPAFYRARGRESITLLVNSPKQWGNADIVTATFVKYRNPGSSAEKGLRRRRVREAELFLRPDPTDTVAP